MSFPFRAATVFFSLLLHSAIVGVGFFFAGNGVPQEEKVYHVSLAEFAPAPAGVPIQEAPPQDEPAAPAEPEVAPPPPEPEPSPPEPVPVPALPKPQPRPQPEAERPKPKPVERKPHQTASPVAQADAQQTATSQVSTPGVPGGTPRMIGGMSAYSEDAVDQRPSISRRAMPEYPDNARRRNIQGEVVVQLVVDTSGNPQQCTVHSSNPEGVFDNAALAAAKKTRFIPGKVRGQPVNTLVVIPYHFKLR